MPAKTKHSHRAPPTPEREAGAAGYDDLLQSITGLAASLQALNQQAVELYKPSGVDSSTAPTARWLDRVPDRDPCGKKITFPLAFVPDPGQASLDRTRQGYARKRILKPAGRCFYTTDVERVAA